jgi:hypothetical protein
MKRILGILAGLMLAASAQAANYQAAADGNWHTTNTWGVTSIPGASDHVDLNGKAITLTNSLTLASLGDVATGGSLDLGVGVTFTCRAVTNAALTTSAASVVVDCDVTLTTGNGITINAGGEVTIAGTWSNSGDGYGVVNGSGTWTDFTGTLNNSGEGYGVYNYGGGTVTDFSGTLNHSGGGYGVVNGGGGTVTDFSGTLNHSGGGYGVVNGSGTWTDFTGTLNNSGEGYGVYNDSSSTWTDFTGTLNNSGSGTGAYNNGGTWTDFSGNLVLSSANVEAIGGDAIPFSGSIKIAAQPDLSAANIVTGKTILGVTGTKAAGYGINGTGLLGASW